MAGAGYKLFNTGDVLTAAQVNTYLMEQTVMVFADAAARTTALTGVVSEGMISYLKDTNAVEVYNGSAWVSSDDPNAIQNTIVDAKGDLITATAADTPARLAVGNNGDTLLADSSTSTGLRYQGSQAAGKNAVINGNMDIWQRGTTGLTANTYTADRWYLTQSGGTSTVSRESTIIPTGAVYSYKIAQTVANGTAYVNQVIETLNAVQFAGKTIAFSMEAAASASTAFAIGVEYSTGTDTTTTGSFTAITATSGGTATISTTTFAPVTGVFAIPSTAKTIKVYLQATITSGQSAYLGKVQFELGSVPTAFTRAGGTLQGELAACQRYYELGRATWTGYVASGNVWGYGNGFKVQKRTSPTMTATMVGDNNFNPATITASDQTVYSSMIKCQADGNGDAYFLIDWSASAEL